MRIGVIGLGQVAETLHLPACRRVADMELVAACDPDPTRATLMREKFGIGVVYGSADELLGRESLDAVIVGTPPGTHRALCTQALVAGAHVFCEKPLALALDDADAVIAEAERQGLHLRVNHQYRFAKICRQTRRRLDAGEFGRPFFIQCWQQMFHPPEWERNWRADLERYTLVEFGTHVVDLTCFFFDDLPLSIDAVMPRPPQPVRSDVLVHAVVGFPGSRVATLCLNRVSHAPERYLEVRIDCEHASVRLSFGGTGRLALEWRRQLRRPAWRCSLSRGGEARVETGGRSRVFARDLRRFQVDATARHLQLFGDEIRDGALSLEAARLSREVLRAALAGYDAASGGKKVHLGDEAPEPGDTDQG